MTSQNKFPDGVFFVRSVQNGLYLDAKGAGTSKGTKLIVWEYNGEKNQQWKFERETGTIRCVHNNLILDIKGGKGPSVICWEYEGKPWQKWKWNGKHITSQSNEKLVLDVKGASNKKGADVIVWEPNGGLNQEWELVTLNGSPYHSEEENKFGDDSSSDSD